MIHSLMLLYRPGFPAPERLAFRPHTDVFRKGRDLIVRIELAGLREEDFKVSVREGTLEISGIRLDYLCKDAYYQMEVPFGAFHIRIVLPDDLSIDEQRISASYEQGFLVIKCPNRRARRIPIEKVAR